MIMRAHCFGADWPRAISTSRAHAASPFRLAPSLPRKSQESRRLSARAAGADGVSVDSAAVAGDAQGRSSPAPASASPPPSAQGSLSEAAVTNRAAALDKNGVPAKSNGTVRSNGAVKSNGAAKSDGAAATKTPTAAPPSTRAPVSPSVSAPAATPSTSPTPGSPSNGAVTLTAAPAGSSVPPVRPPAVSVGRTVRRRPFPVGQKPAVPPSVFEYFHAIRVLEESERGPPRFFCPLEAKPDADEGDVLPRLFFLPGIEGTGFGLALHHKSLARIFEVSCLSIPLNDRTSFQGLIELVEAELLEEHTHSPERALFLVGESFGALIALAVAERHPELPISLVLVNPATAFQSSQLQPFLPIIPLVPEFAYTALPFLFSFSLGNPVKMASSGIPFGASPLERALAVRDNLLNMIPIIPEVSKLLPQDTLVWKLKLLEEGCKYVEALLPRISCPTLIVASEEDQLVPSKEEAKRLKEAMIGTKALVRNCADSGHTLLLEGDFDIAAVIKGSGLYRRTSSPRENPLIDSFPFPTVEDLARARSGTDGFVRALCSPVFLSTLEDGQIVRGFDGVPTDHRPLLFVGNHQTFAPDLSVLVGEFLEKTGILMRGLAHPMAMGMGPGQSEEVPQNPMTETFRTFGAVPVTPTAAYKLLNNGEAVLLFPGGAREALKNRGEEYQLFWPEREEFVRMAIKFNATIVPFAAIGVDDAYNVVIDGNEMLQNPLLSERTKKFLEAVPKVRDESAGPAMEQFVPPIVTPKEINRLYFLFRKPIRTTDLTFALKDREVTNGLYRHVKGEVEDGLSYLLRKREEDPYKDFWTRAVYEASWGGQRQAPTFSP